MLNLISSLSMEVRMSLWKTVLFLSVSLASSRIDAGLELPSVRKWIMPAKKLREYERFFSPVLFLPYRSQLEACISEALAKEPELATKLDSSSPFFQEMRKLLELSEECPAAHAKSHREWHQRWLKQLRRALSSKALLTRQYDPASEGAKRVLDAICLFMFSEAEFFDNISKLLALELNLEYPADKLKTEMIPEVLEKAWKKISRHDSVSGFKRQSKESGDPTHDPHYGGILPTRLFSIGSAQLIYTPRVTQEYKKEEATVSPEYLRYLHALANNGKQHLYINLMDRTDEKEEQLSRKIEALERMEKSLHVITLDHNSNFYKQRYTNLENAAVFKKAFLKKLFEEDGKSHFYWSESIEPDSWRQECLLMIDNVHAQYFHNKETLSIDERKAFIDITYISQIRALLKRYDHANITCKHAMDRAPQLISLLFAHEIVRTQADWSPDNVAKFLSIVLAPPVLSHNRPSAERHIKRISNTIRYLQ